MNPKLVTSLESLNSWVSKIIEEGSRRSWNLSDFIETQDIKSFQQFYNEIIPYIESIKIELPETEKLVVEYIANKISLIENSKDKNIFWRIIRDWDLPVKGGASIEKLMFTLTDIKNNVSNILYQIKINQD